MRLPRHMCTAAVLVLILSGCPKTATTASPAPAIAVEDATIGKLARILRASDRRIVDDDLRALAKDSDASIREKAVLALGQIADPSSLAALDAAGTDAEAGVRASAAFAMGLIADRASEASLERLAADASSGVRAAAAEALGRVHEPGGAAAIQTLLEDADPQVHAAAGLAAWKFAEPEPLLASLIAGLSSTDGHVRMACSYALARLASVGSAPASSGAPVGHLSESGVTQAKTALTSHVADPDPEVRMNVARGLASPRAGSELAVVGTLSKDPVPGVRVNAARALGYPGISIKPYLENATADKDPAVIRTALEAVGAAGGGGAVSVLNDLVPKLENGWLREAALLALAKADPSKTPDIVAGLLANPDPRLRAAAATLVAGHREALAIRAALALLADPVPSVKALGAPLVASQDGPVSNLLAGFFKFPDPVVRAAVSEVVGDRFANRHHDVESPDDLFARLEEIWASSTSDGIPDAKLAVVDAAAKAGKDDRSKAVFTRALADPDVIVRRRAAVRLREVYGEDRSGEVGPASTRSLADYERVVKWSRVPHAAVVSLQRPGTAVGRFTIALDSAAAPMAAWNFAELAAKGFFDGASVHRVVPNFVVQDGDPRGDGFGGPGYSIRDEFNPLTFSAGVLGMASDGKDTAGSQWFITLSPQPHLDGRYTTFGRVVRGFREIVTQIRPGDTVVSIRVYEGTGVEPFPN